MNRLNLLLISLLIFVSCQINEVEQLTKVRAVPMTFYADFEMPFDNIDTKIYLGGDPFDPFRSILWEYDDEIFVTNEISSSKFTNKAEQSSNIAVFKGVLSEGTKYYSVYPFSIVEKYTSSGFEVVLPAIQTYHKDGIAPECFPMVAQCNDGIFNFKNLSGIFVLQLLGEQTISSISFQATDNNGNYRNVAGNGVISMHNGDYPSLDLMSSSVTSVVLKCPGGVKLNKTVPTLFHLVLPVATYESFKIKVKTTSGMSTVISSEHPLSVKRSIRTISSELNCVCDVFDVVDLSQSGTANSYIVSEAGEYKFAAVQGNSSTSVGSVCYAEVLWESFGTDIEPSVGDLIKSVSYRDGYITFQTASAFKEGNAVIAAKDASGNILWSWHIWFTDQPAEHEYYNNVGVMMDRNLGATSATPGDVGALGLLYQWGRKDPFLGSASISNSVEPKSTVVWPSAVQSNGNTGTISYVVSNPLQYITGNTYNSDWYYTRTSSTDDTRWAATKTIYDPCPVGWIVPAIRVWTVSSGTYDEFRGYPYDREKEGMNFSGKFGADTMIWYPSSGYRVYNSGALSATGSFGDYWSTFVLGNKAYFLRLSYDGYVNPFYDYSRSMACAVRCVREQ